MKRVLTFGTFDCLHLGHKNFFQQAKRFGDKLVVIVARDRNVKILKGYKPKENEKVRLKRVKDLKIVDKVYLGNINLNKRYEMLGKIKPDLICLGYDQEVSIKDLKKEIRKRKIFCQIIRLKPYKPEKYKSSIINT